MSAAPWWTAHVDGGCHPNPEGVMGIGVVLRDPSGRLAAEVSARPAKKGTNNEAEYLAVLRALQEALDRGATHLEVLADSRLTVNTLSGAWQVRAPNLRPLKALIDAEARHFQGLRFRWIPREKNKEADKLATEAIGGTVGGASKYGADAKRGAAPGQPAKAPARPAAEGALCGACKKMCVFSWQRFSNGSTHVRQECPTHGFLRFAPDEHPWTELAGPRPR